MSEETFASLEAAVAHLNVDLGHENILEMPDLRLAIEALPNKIVVLLDKFKSGYECTKCKGSGKLRSLVVEGALRTCDQCNGRGASLIIPQNAQSIATTGVVVSIGEGVTKIKLHSRVICGPYSGVALPMKGNIEVKIYHEDEPLAVLYNLNPNGTLVKKSIDEDNQIIELDTSKFVEHDTPLAETNNA
jgi:co-chaperonin GroES (HSP10)